MDDALDGILDRIAAGLPMPTDEQMDDLIGNRRRKYRARRHTLETTYFEITKDAALRDRSDGQATLTARLGLFLTPSAARAEQ